MAYSNRTYPGTGAQTDFQVDFPYLDADHIGVAVDGVSTAFTWVNSQTVRISPAPGNGTSVKISRDSSRASRIASFADSQSLTAAALNEDIKQAFYVAQEAFDAVSEAPSGGDLRAVNNLSEVNPSAARSNLGALASSNPAIAGNLTLDAAPSDPLHAVSKAWVEAQIAAIPSGSGEVNTMASVGAGASLYKEKAGVQFKLRTLVQGTGVVITEGTDTIQIDATGVGGGEVNTAASAGVTGLPVYKEKAGVELRFKGVGKFDDTLSQADSTANDILLKVNQAYGMQWTSEQKFTGGTAVPTVSSALHGIDVAGGALTSISKRVTKTAANTLATAQVQSADVTHVVTGTNTTVWEWAQLVILDNYCATAGTDQVGSYVKAYKRSGSLANHWGVAIETSNLSSDKSGAHYGMEIRTDTNGTEVAAKSGPLALFYGSNSGGNSYFDHGLLIEPSDAQTGARLGYGIRIEGRPDVAIAQGLQGGGFSGTSMIAAHGKYTGPVIDTAGNAGASCGIRLKSGQAVRMSGTDSFERDMVWNSGSNRMEFQYDGTVGLDIPLYDRNSTSSSNYSLGLWTSADTNHVKTSVTGGGAPAVNPVGYIRIKVDGNHYRLALYNN